MGIGRIRTVVIDEGLEFRDTMKLEVTSTIIARDHYNCQLPTLSTLHFVHSQFIDNKVETDKVDWTKWELLTWDVDQMGISNVRRIDKIRRHVR